MRLRPYLLAGLLYAAACGPSADKVTETPSGPAPVPVVTPQPYVSPCERLEKKVGFNYVVTDSQRSTASRFTIYNSDGGKAHSALVVRSPDGEIYMYDLDCDTEPDVMRSFQKTSAGRLSLEISEVGGKIQAKLLMGNEDGRFPEGEELSAYATRLFEQRSRDFCNFIDRPGFRESYDAYRAAPPVALPEIKPLY